MSEWLENLEVTEEKSKPKKEIPKEQCPYCGKKYQRLEMHLNYCNENPANQIKEKLKPLTVNAIFEKVIEFCTGKQAKAYARTLKILTSHDNNRNYQSHIMRDLVEILMEMGVIK